MIQELQKMSSLSGGPTSLLDASIALLLSFVLCYFVRVVYHSSKAKHTFDPHFNSVLLFLAPVLSVVMMLIGSNLALSIGMVGSLSIIRFRNVIKSSRDMVYIFWLIAIGLGCGTYSYKITILATLIIGGVLFVFEKTKSGSETEKQLVIRGKGKIPLENIRKVLGEHRTLHWQEHADGWDYMAEYKFTQSEAVIMDQLRSLGADHLAFHENH